ncbi:tape measure protein [Bartonella sp. HY329]|uniref:tape measure protein n=1 Tax=unclassified Bartonella TaxID=2645622 RepID=UPI0021C7D446|nr:MULTISPECIES: tape measure protein [unclassified Bartonella]UXM94642.1 tape measure protein [Bartonella sp. HY329]UXN08965.1 tape measure protein [Bartonella sp. HY328]
MDIANLGITVNSAQLLLAAERMDKMGGAAKAIENRLYGFNTSAKRTETALSRIADRANGATKVFSGFKNVLQIAGIDLATKEVMRFADTWVNAGNKIKAASQASGMQSRSLNQLRSGADNARTGLEEYVSLYSHILRNSKGVAQSEEDIAKATNLVSKAFVLGGTTASEQAASILQLGQALGSGVLEGDELRSISENAPLLAQVIADGFGTTVEGLKKFGAEGEITTAKFLQLILAAGSTIESQFQKMPITMEQGVTLVQNAGLQYIGTMNEITGASHLIGGGLQILANNMDLVGNAMLAFSAISAGRIFGPMIAEPAKALSSILSLDAAFLKSNATMLNTRSAALARAKAAHEVALADKNAAAAALQAAQADRVLAVAALESAKAGQLVGMTRAQAAGQLVLANKAVNAASLTMAAQSKTTAQTLGVMNIAMKNASFSARVMSVAMGGLSFLGGPLGVAVTAVGAVSLAVASYQGAAKDATERTANLKSELQSLGLMAKEAAQGMDGVKSTTDNIQVLDETTDKVNELQAEYKRLREGSGWWGGSQGDELPNLIKSAPRGFTVNEGQTQKGVLAVKATLQDLDAKMISTEEALKRIGTAQGLDEANTKLQAYAKSALQTVGYMNALEQAAAQKGVNLNLQPLLDKIDETQQHFNWLLDPHSTGQNESAKKTVENLLNEIKKGGDAAVDAQKKLDGMFGTKARGLLEILGQVVGELNKVNNISGAINQTMTNASWAEFIKPFTDIGKQAIDAYKTAEAQYEAGEAYLKKQEELNARTKEQIDYDTRLTQLRQNAIKDKVILQPDQEDRFIKGQIANDNRLKNQAYPNNGVKSLEGVSSAYQNLLKSADDRMLQLELETQLVGKTGIAADAYKIKLELLKAAEEQFGKLTPKMVKDAEQKAEAYEKIAEATAKAKLNADLNNERTRMGLSTVEQGVYDKMNQYNIPYGSNQQAAAAIRYNSILQMGLGYAQSFANTLTAGLVNGTKFTENLGSAFKNLGNQILSMATNDLISGLFRNLLGLGGGGGWLSSLLGGLGGGFPAAPSAIGPVGLYANGGAFGTGSQRFAKGGAFTNSIISKPTAFRFADGGSFSSGLMGEAGPEAILPLKRDAQGRLGVSQHGEGGNPGGSGTLTNVSVDVKASKYFDVIVGQKAQEISQQQIKQFAQSPQLKQVAEQVTRGVIKTPSKRF